jgi:hypothetical protein
VGHHKWQAAIYAWAIQHFELRASCRAAAVLLHAVSASLCICTGLIEISRELYAALIWSIDAVQ